MGDEGRYRLCTSRVLRWRHSQDSLPCRGRCKCSRTGAYHEHVVWNVGLEGLAARADGHHEFLLPGRLQHPGHVQAQPLVRCRPLWLCNGYRLCSTPPISLHGSHLCHFTER